MSPDHVSVVGVDVAARTLHIVGLATDGRVSVCESVEADEIEPWIAALAPRTPIGIDGPGGPSAAPFAADETIGRKFRTARGCEVELGRQYRLWVSFPTPTDIAAFAPWMSTAVRLFQTVERHGHIPLETWPYATFHMLGGTRPPKKTTASGRLARLDLLHAHGVFDPEGRLQRAGHDLVDAAGAALVAWHHRHGQAMSVRCELDGTCLWLPSTGRR